MHNAGLGPQCQSTSSDSLQTAYKQLMAQSVGTPGFLFQKYFLLYVCFFLSLYWNNTKKQKKILIWYNFTQNFKNGPDNIFGTFSKFVEITFFSKHLMLV